jgi:hypothetical protein
LRVGQADRESCTPKFDALWFCYCEWQLPRRSCSLPPPPPLPPHLPQP